MTLPQANNIDAIIATVEAVHLGRFSMHDIGEYIGMGDRQGAYYCDAALQLGLLRRDINAVPYLTERGKRIRATTDQKRRIGILRHAVQQVAGVETILEYLRTNPDHCTVSDVERILASQYDLADTTLERRTSTILTWLKALHFVAMDTDQRIRLCD